tara:strand:- start:139 stop:1488 length:1350 start_codon:yes stop_codon:yes gene_type:complete
MRPLNRPMFKNGGPIKEGIMQGMKEPQAINTVGSPLAPKDETGRGGYALPLLAFAAPVATTAARILAPRAIMGGLRSLYGGFRGAKYVGPTDKGLTGMQRLRNLLPTGRFLQPATPTGQRIAGKYVPAPLRFSEAIRSPEVIGRAIRENPFTAFGVAGQIKNIPDIVSGGAGLAADAALGATNYLLGTEFSRDKSNIKTDEVNKDLKRVENLTTEKSVGEVDTKSDKLSEDEKNKINEDRINETKQKYYKLMGVDKLNKDAVYNTLIDASNKIREDGNIKDQLKSGNLVSNVINSLSKNLDSSVDLKKQIDAAILKGEIEKDINKTKLTSFQEQIKFIKENPNDPLAKKLAGASSVADIVAASAAQGKSSTITSNDIASMIDSKGTNVSGTIPDDQYQKWFKSNKNKDEIDFFIEKYSGADDGLYVVNKKAFIKRGNEIAPISLDSIIG